MQRKISFILFWALLGHNLFVKAQLGTLQRNQPLAPVDKKIGNNIGRFPDLLTGLFLEGPMKMSQQFFCDMIVCNLRRRDRRAMGDV